MQTATAPSRSTNSMFVHRSTVYRWIGRFGRYQARQRSAFGVRSAGAGGWTRRTADSGAAGPTAGAIARTVRWWTCTFPNGATRPPPAPSSSGPSPRPASSLSASSPTRRPATHPCCGHSPSAEHRSSKYLNNGLERDHGHLKQRLRPMRGFKQLTSADGYPRPRPRPEPAATASRRSPTECRVRCAWQRPGRTSPTRSERDLWPRAETHALGRASRWLPTSLQQNRVRRGASLAQVLFAPAIFALLSLAPVWTDDHPAVIAHPTVWTSRRR